MATINENDRARRTRERALCQAYEDGDRDMLAVTAIEGRERKCARARERRRSGDMLECRERAPTKHEPPAITDNPGSASSPRAFNAASTSAQGPGWRELAGVAACIVAAVAGVAWFAARGSASAP